MFNKTKNITNKNTLIQSGFTLIELMVSLVIGLLIVAAVMQVYLSSSRTAVVQQSGANIVDANIFGLQWLERRLKLANLGMADAITGDKLGSGIIFNPSKNLKGIQLENNTPVSIGLLTRNSDDTVSTRPQWTGASNDNNKSDQLTIQYRAPQNTVDCEGQIALGPRVVKVRNAPKIIDGQIIIERYFLKKDGDKLALACDAGRYINEIMDNYAEQGDPNSPITVFEAPNVIKNFGDSGQVIMDNVDDFQVLLGVTTPDGIRYVTSSDYLSKKFTFDPSLKKAPIPLEKLPVVSLKIGLITSGDTSLPGGEKGPSSFSLLGNTVTINSSTDKNLIRHVYEDSVSLRNASQP